MDMQKFPSQLVVAYFDKRTLGQSLPKAIPIAVIVAVVKAALEAIKQRDFEKWRSDVSTKLDEISQKLDIIIRDIQALKAQIDEVPAKTAVTLFRTEIDSRRLRIEQVIAGIKGDEITDEQRARLVELSDGLSTPLGQLQIWTEFGFEPYAAVLSGTLTMLMAYSYIKPQTGEVTQFAKDVIERYLSPAVDQNIPQSLEAARNSVAHQVGVRQLALESVLNRWWQVNMSFVHQGRDDPSVGVGGKVSAIHALARGSVGDGFTIVSRATDHQIEWYPVLPRHFDIGDGFSASGPSVRWDIEQNRAAALIDAVAREATLRSHIDQVIEVREVLRNLV